jgi:fatty acid desaturase
MKPLCTKRPWICRVLTIAAGLALFTAGIYVGNMWGLVLMIVGLVPAVTGVADVSLLAEIREDRVHRRERRRLGSVAHWPRA